MAELSFDIGGFIRVNDDMIPGEDCNGNIVRYTLPDGRVARMIMALEIEDTKGNVVCVTSEAEMGKLGFTGLEYKDLMFSDTGYNSLAAYICDEYICDECGAARDATGSLMGSNHKESCSLFRK